MHQSCFSQGDYQRQPELQLSVTPHSHTGSLWDLKEPERSDFMQNWTQRSIQKTESVWEEERQYWVVEILLQTLNNLFEMNTHKTSAHTHFFCCQFLYLPVSCCHKLKEEVCKDDFLCLIPAISIWEPLFSEWTSLICFTKKNKWKSKRRANALCIVAVPYSSRFSNIHYPSIFILQSSEKQIILLHLVSTKKAERIWMYLEGETKIAPDFFLSL